jgi:hypothetical protein
MAARRQRLTKGETSYESLRGDHASGHHSLLNILSVGMFTAHLIEREYSVYVRITANQEVVIRIYDNEDKYELVIYPYEDARQLVIDACGRLGGKADMEKLIGLVHRLEALLEASEGTERSRLSKTPRRTSSEASGPS